MEQSREIPTATSFRTLTVTVLDERRKQLKAAGQRVSFTHLIAYAIARVATDEMPVMAHHFAEIDGKPHRVDDGAVNLGLAVDVEKKDGSRTLMVPVIRDAGRLSFRRVPRRLQRPRREGAHQHPGRRRPPGRQHLADESRRDRHRRLGSAPDGRPGHDRRHRLDRLPGRTGADRPDDRRREGHDDDLHLRPPHHPGRRVRPLPPARRGAASGRGGLLRQGVRRPRGRSFPSCRRRPRAAAAAAVSAPVPGAAETTHRPRRGAHAGRPGGDLAAQGPPHPRPPGGAAGPARPRARRAIRRSTRCRSG